MNRTNTVLLVSEMNTINNVLINTLEKQGFYTVHTNAFEEKIKKAIFINLPDILLIDYDIITINLESIIKYFKEEYSNKKKIIFMATKMTSIEKSQFIEKGVDLIVDKPFNFTYLCHKINNILDNKNIEEDAIYDLDTTQSMNKRIYELVEEEIFKMGITSNSKAWNKLCDVIELIVINNGNVDKIRQNIYLKVAEKYGTSDEGIDSTLRRCISIVWKNGNRKYLKHYFNVYTENNWIKFNPTNKHFLRVVSNNVIKKLEKISKFEKLLEIKRKK